MKAKYTLLSLAVLCAIAQISVACSNCEERKNLNEEKCSSCQKPPKPSKETEERGCSCQKPPKPTKNQETKVTAEIAVGELADKITILEIKLENITDEAKLKNIATELETLKATYYTHVEQTPELKTLKRRLLEINKMLWAIEDDIRDKERDKEFNSDFIQLARDVYYTNDERCAVKRQINNLTGSRLVEEKSYSDYA